MYLCNLKNSIDLRRYLSGGAGGMNSWKSRTGMSGGEGFSMNMYTLEFKVVYTASGCTDIDK